MIATLIVRIFQVLFAACVLGLSITAVKWQYYGTAPAVSSFNAFAGAFALLTALIGIVAIWISHIPGLIMAVVDGVAFIFLLAGGIVSHPCPVVVITTNKDGTLTTYRHMPSS